MTKSDPVLRLVFATGNPNKVREIREILGESSGSIRIISLEATGFHGEIPETRDTIEGNSLQKAEFLRDELNRDGFAEDTGLEVAALDGAPGIYSARYAGPQKSAEDNMDLLLRNMDGVTDRRARFRTVVTLIIGDTVRQFEGVLTGRIAESRKGKGGFGYDPVFRLDDGRTLAELDPSEKAAISHRSIAVDKLMNYLRNEYI